MPDAYSPDKQRSRHSTIPDNTSISNKLGLPMLSPKSPTEKQEPSSLDSPHLPSMYQRPCTTSNRENKKNGLLQWVNRPATNAASDRLKWHRSFKTPPEPEPCQVFQYPIEKQPSLENLSVTTDGTFTGLDNPSMLSIHSVESDALDWSRPHGAGHLVASPPFVPSPVSSTFQHSHNHHSIHRTQTIPSRPPSSSVDRQLPSITPKANKPGRIKKWHSERIKGRFV